MRRGVLLMILVAAGCAPGPASRASDTAAESVAPAPPATSPAATPPAATSPAPADTALLARLEREARALARTDGCTAAAGCQVAPVGSRPCGGPRDYVAFCATTTDTVALFAKLAELRRAEEAYNREQGMMSTCEFRAPPGVELSGGTCRAVAVGGPREPPQP